MMYVRIEAQRIKKGLTPEELSEKLNVSCETYYKWIRNGDIPASKIIIMSEIFKCSVDHLLGLK